MNDILVHAGSDRRKRAPHVLFSAALAAALLAALPAFAQPADPPPDAPKPLEAPKPADPATPPDAPKPPPADAPKPPEPPPPPRPQSGFGFGSYGRVIAATDARGRPARDADIVAHGSRLDEGNYVELELHRNDYWQKTDSTTRIVATLAVAGQPFHYNGTFDAKIAVRNLFIEERDLGLKGLSVWAGSRMYRGDDIYLLDWWPLDSLNTMGGGARFDILKNTFLALHGGLSQPSSSFYVQEVNRPPVFNQTGAAKVTILNRQRFIGSAKASHIFPIGEGGIKLVAYGEAHRLPAGQRESKIPQKFEDVPGDGGVVIGGQVSAYTGQRGTHLNLYFRYATGLAAYGDFATPSELGVDKTASGAREILGALGGNWEIGPFGLLAGAYIRSFRNASKALDFDDVDEGIVALRPQIFFGEIGGLAVEGSYQAQQRGVLAAIDTSADGAVTPVPVPTGGLNASLFRIGVVPFFSPAGRGSFSRPQIRVIYVATFRDQGARSLYPQDDVFSLHKVEHFFGFGAEWWFNSSSYGR